MNRRLKICTLMSVIALGACGKMGGLEPKLGAKPIPAAYGSDQPASAEQLATASAQARPGRSVELLRRSNRREEDPFDLPPGETAMPTEPAAPDSGNQTSSPSPKTR